MRPLFSDAPLRLVFVFLALLFSTNNADAWSWYFEFGGNLGKITNPAPLLSGAPTTTLNSPLFIPTTLGFQLQDIGDFPQFQLGIQNHYFQGSGVSTITGSSESYTVVPTYGVARIELWRLMLGAGYSNWVWNGLFTKAIPGASAILLEGSFLFPITPEIDFGINYARQSFSTSAGTGPTTSEYGGFFRLNYGLTSEQKERKRKYKGWRYPLGIWKP